MLGYSKEELGKLSGEEMIAPEAVEETARAWGTQIENKGYFVLETLWVRKDGSRIPVEVSGKPLELGDRVVFQLIARDITERKRVEEALRQSLENVRTTLKSTIEAMALAVELRDPYTAGHQRRVTHLACAIADEMTLSAELVDGIQMVGTIHDIGKICIPAEILSKPGRLTEAEFAIMKAHCQTGYAILKRIEFPQPIAQIVLQHHERIDGSGYPAGLSGEDISMEARIIAVADVAEAMASHRPYRPALGIDKALEELSQERGILYEPEVVDACVKLLSQRQVTLE